MKNKLFYSLLLLPILTLSFYTVAFSKKNYAPPKQTGANGEPSCGSSTTSCHFSANCNGGSESILDVMNHDLYLTANGVEVDASFKYTPGDVYNMEFKILNPTARNGFSLTSMDDANNYSGTLSVVSGAEAEISSSNSNYVGHTNTLGVNQWSFKWEAPSAGTGNVSFYASANKGSNDSPFPNPCKDTIIPFKITISEALEETVDTTGINSLSILNDLAILNNPILNNQILIETFVKEPKQFFIAVYDLSGKQVYFAEQVFHVGLKNIAIPLNVKGVFIVNITTNKNEFANYKILNK